MKTIYSLLVALTVLTFVCPAQVKVQNLSCEDRINPIGLDDSPPRFSWQLASDKRNVMQTAYEIRIGTDVSNRSMDVKVIGSEKGYVMLNVGSGKYNFTSTVKQ